MDIEVNGEPHHLNRVAGFTITENGIFEGAIADPDSFISDIVYIDCILKKDNDRFIRICARDHSTGEMFHTIFPRSYLLPDHQSLLIKKLYDLGLTINTKKMSKLKTYLSSYQANRTAQAFGRTGWATTEDHRKIFILPNRIFGADTTEAVFMPDTQSSAHTTIQSKGTLKSWQDNIAGLCRVNPILGFSLGISFAAPLLELVSVDGGGFNIVAPSSRGKTISIQVCASVWGCSIDPAHSAERSYIRRWNTTQNALEALAESYNHLPLPMDELGTHNIKNFGATVYQITCGSGKDAMTANRDLRAPRSWKNLIMSTGEITINSEIEASSGKQARTGQLIRFIDLVIQDSLFSGVEESSRQWIADNLKSACENHYGTAGAQYLDYLVSRVNTEPGYPQALNERLETLRDQLSNEFTDLQPEQRRALKRFAMSCLGLEVARDAGCIDFTNEDVYSYASTAVRIWLEEFRSVSETDRAYEQLREFILTNQGKFGEAHCGDRDPSSALVGYFSQNKGLYYFTKDQFSKAIGRTNIKPILKELEKDGFLHQNDDQPNGAPRIFSRANIRGSQLRVVALDKRFLEYGDDVNPNQQSATSERVEGEAQQTTSSPPSKPTL